jgi:pimeloyl-ACP methyl ester carboxylesterase
MELLVADALGIADGLNAKRFHLVGHDWGGQLAWLIGARHPERLISLSVLSRPHPAAFAAALGADREQAGRSRHHGAFDDPATAERLLDNDARRLRRMLEGQGVAASDADRYLSAFDSRAALDAALNWYRAARHSAKDLHAASLPPVRVPTLYLWGDQDATVGRAAAELTQQHVSAPFRLKVVPNAGHFLTDQAPEAVSAALLEHLAAFRE